MEKPASYSFIHKNTYGTTFAQATFTKPTTAILDLSGMITFLYTVPVAQIRLFSLANCARTFIFGIGLQLASPLHLIYTNLTRVQLDLYTHTIYKVCIKMFI